MVITEFVNKLSPRARQRADFLVQAFSLAVVGSLVYYGRDTRRAYSPRPHSRWVSTRPRPCPVAR
jgi:hypothetical protein